jgi:hypothetical protein
LSKQKSTLSYIYKIHSSRLRKSNWSINLSIKEAIENNEMISIGDSAALRFIRKIEDSDFNHDKFQEKVKKIKMHIKKIKKMQTSSENRKYIGKLYDNLYDILFIKHYICIVIDKIKDFDRMNSGKSFYVNGLKYKRLLATTGGSKNSTVVYVSEDIFEPLYEKIENSRNINKKIVPAKLEAYKSLVCSGSTPVSNPKGVLVVNDCITKFKANIIKIDDTSSKYPIISQEKDYEINLEESDGYGLISPSLSHEWGEELGEEGYIPSGFCIRNSFTKGMLFSFDFRRFSEEVANKNYLVEDAWGDIIDIRNVEVILTTSMLKLWDSYNSIEHYLECCENNGYTFCVTKVTPKELENQRNMNYQFIQSLNLSDEHLEELINPTIDEIHDVLGGDYRKSLLFLKGVHISEDEFVNSDNDFVKSLMIDKRMINDPFVRGRIHNMIKKRIKDAKVGVLKVRGNFSTISGDPYSLCQSIFKMKITGLLKSGEFYSKYWSDKNVDKVACFRAPMTCHNNIRILRLINNEKVKSWYKHMNTVTIFNSWDTTTHALNGADKDGDSIMTTNNKVILDSIEELDAIMCVQKTATKKIVENHDLIKANKDSFGDVIGSTTNRITTMFDVRANFKPDSEEYKELNYRIQCGQNYQQNAIDKAKGIMSKPMPKEWFDYKSNIIQKDDGEEDVVRKEMNIKILANKKPYFFTYIYPEQMREYRKYMDNCEKNCIRAFGVSVAQLKDKNDKSDQENIFLKYYYQKMPVFITPSVMNKICWRIEEEFDNLKNIYQEEKFDYHLLMSDQEYTKGRYNKVKDLYIEHNAKMQEYAQEVKRKRIKNTDAQSQRIIFVQSFREKALKLCNNAEELCNIVIELCYKGNRKSKQFAWDICGDQIIENLLKKNNYTHRYPTLDKDGDIEYLGERFSMVIESEVSEYEDYFE